MLKREPRVYVYPNTVAACTNHRQDKDLFEPKLAAFFSQHLRATTPAEADLEFITSDKAKRFMKGLPFKPKVPFDTSFPKANRSALDLLNSMLVFNPSKRITVNEALAHPYMESLHAEEDEPVASEVFNFDFEQQELTKHKLQELIAAESLAFHPEHEARLRGT